jgi:hypothetical protein
MGLRSLGLVLIAVGVAGLAVAVIAGVDGAPLFFRIESGIAVVAGMTSLAIGGLRHGYHSRPLGAPPGDMDMAQAIDPEPAVGDTSSR